jgi:pSer/pThr/pTyr-binding forkhead associated (FHA) protein
MKPMAFGEPTGYLMGAGTRPLALHPGDVLTFGRDPQNSVFLEDAMVSRRHAVLEFHIDGSVLLRDLGSRNGTYVNGERLPENQPTPLRNGDSIRIGGKVLTYIGGSTTEDPRQIARLMTQRLTEDETVSPGQLKVSDVWGANPPIDPKAARQPTVRTELPAPKSTLSGNLSDQNFIQMATFLNSNRKTGDLRLQTPNFQGIVSFNKGEIFHAEAGPLAGFDAILRLSNENEGIFHWNNRDTPPDRKPNVQGGTLLIILEVCRQLDEANRG